VVARVIEGEKSSRPVENKIATVLGVAHKDLFGVGPFTLWRAA